jgi:N-alpha-acetyltransferase 15/16, NatA auxiliary subunit
MLINPRRLIHSLDKYLLALRCLLAASKLELNHPTVHEQIIRFKLAVDSVLSSLPAKTAEVIKAEFTLLPESKTVSDINDDFLSKNDKSIRHIYSFHRVRRLLPSFDQSKSEAEILSALDHLDMTLDEVSEGLELLSSWKANTEAYRSKAHSQWPKATVFEESQ